ncbi:huntingtin-interacting protein 1 isoform X3 [Contarinia nasturtii]|uniref:huntingtin-interacting protein 1 isoform X3 n=1 Tax=Contarinia nasturtii TaxID=265458 RepID=UPI0012D494D9|nr:huntingtin-interacting protein 1 isoform X3 [Contarinia nasturtii]
MSSISLTRILQTKKSNGEADKELFDKQMTVSISKALSGTEMPLKVKHARVAIIGTFHSRGAHSFWAVALRQPLQENRITAWKFCYLLHKVLREGHPLSCQHSMRHRGMLTELGKLWGHLNDGYGVCIRHYTKLLVNKLEFHDRNPRIPPNLTMKRGELDVIGGGDINFYFQMAVEMFDYLDDIIALEAAIFSSITTFHVNSMTSAGQCRLSPLIPLIQDSSQLYDFLVRIMFKLHSNLPNDVLAGHRDRFRTIFTQLKSFYNQSRNLQYFVNLITVPKLPENAPNFSSQVDFGAYTPPVVVIPEPEPEPLVDMSMPTLSLPSHDDSPQDPPTPTVNFEQLIRERDELILHLQTEVDRLGKNLKAAALHKRDEHAQYEETIASLNSELSDAHEQLTNMRFVKEELELKAQSVEKTQVEEEKLKASEEKFQKLKVMYAQIRDEHVKLLRQHGDVSKQLAGQTKVASDATKERDDLRIQLEETLYKQSKLEESVQQSSNDVKSANDDLQRRIIQLENENSALSAKYDDLNANKSAEVAELRVLLDQYESELKSLKSWSSTISTEKEELDEKHKNIITDNAMLLAKIQELQNSVPELEVKCDNLAEKEQQLREAIEELEGAKAELITKQNELVKERDNLLTRCEEFTQTIYEYDVEKITMAGKMEEMQNKLEDEYNEKLSQTNNTIHTLEEALKNSRISGDARIRALVETCIKSSEKMVTRAAAETDVAVAAGTSAYFMLFSEELMELLNELSMAHSNYVSDSYKNVEALARKSILMGHLMATVYIQGNNICKTSANIELGERIMDEIKKWNSTSLELFSSLMSTHESKEVQNRIDEVKKRLEQISTMIHELSKQSESGEDIGEIIERELSGMDKAIEEAASRIEEMLSKSKASDSGIKLEVNEKILDACTALMKAIRELVKKSRILQAEIVGLGKGTASATEFYKRNHQWTEGLISAAKNVAQGANFLVTAANKAVSGEAKNHLDLIVVAQEIAASTAQLVIASRVKAPKESQNLVALAMSSRDVTQATGAVVATAKDCGQRLEESQDLDLTKLTVHQAKTLEMEIQVKVLELEQALQVERSRLASFRRKNYHN